MQDVMTFTVAVAGLFFSIMCALALEEFIFGGLFHLLRPVAAKDVPQTTPEHDLFGREPSS